MRTLLPLVDYAVGQQMQAIREGQRGGMRTIQSEVASPGSDIRADMLPLQTWRVAGSPKWFTRADQGADAPSFGLFPWSGKRQCRSLWC